MCVCCVVSGKSRCFHNSSGALVVYLVNGRQKIGAESCGEGADGRAGARLRTRLPCQQSQLLTIGDCVFY